MNEAISDLDKSEPVELKDSIFTTVEFTMEHKGYTMSSGYKITPRLMEQLEKDPEIFFNRYFSKLRTDITKKYTEKFGDLKNE